MRAIATALFLLLITVAAGTQEAVESTEETSSAEAPIVAATPTDDTGATPSWGERLEPNRFTIGAFPNSSGNVDFRLVARVRVLDRFSTGLEANYVTYTTSFEASADSPIEGTSNDTETELLVDVLKTIIPLSTGPQLAFSLEPGIHGKYITTENETYGYRTNTDDSVSFFRYSATTRQIVAGLFADATGDLASILSANIRGAAYPLVVILKSGSKLYSQIENPVEFSTQNFAMGFETTGELGVNINRLVGRSVGELTLNGGFLRRFGEYSSENIIALYNWKTTINTVAPLTRTVFNLGGDFALSFLGRWIDVIPAIALSYERTIENYDATVSDTTIWRTGLSASF